MKQNSSTSPNSPENLATPNYPDQYDDIIDLPRPNSKYPKLDSDSRAAQFAPFAALVGFARQIRETGADHLSAVENELTLEIDLSAAEAELAVENELTLETDAENPETFE